MSASECKIAELEAEIVKLRHILSQQLRSDDTIWSDGGVNEQGKPFVTLRWGDLGGQFTTQQMRAFALTLIQTADAAEYDAAVVRGAREHEFGGEDDIGRLLMMVREFRAVEGAHSGEARAQPEITATEQPPSRPGM